MKNENNNDAFVMAENEGRAIALKALNTFCVFKDGFDDYKIVPMGLSCEYDFEVRDNEDNTLLAVIEAKDRKMPSFDRRIVWEGCHLESKKFDALKRIADAKDIPCYYLATFSDNSYKMWDVATTLAKKSNVMCNATTAVKTAKVAKDCYFFEVERADFKGSF